MRKLIVKNSFSGVALALINIALLLIVIPVFVSKLGMERYGVFSLLIILGNLNVLANLGLTTALIKFLAEQGKTKDSHYDIAISLILTIAFIIPIIIVAIYFNKFVLVSILNIPDAYFDEARSFYFFLLGSNFLLIIGQIPRAVLDSEQKIVATNFLQLLYSFLYWGLILLTVSLGYSLPEVGVVSLFAALLWLFAVTNKALNCWGSIQLDGLFSNFKRVVIKQVSYGSKIYAGSLLGFFFEPLSKILISNFIGITEVGYLDIALRLKAQIYNLFSKLFYPLYPLISSLNDNDKIRILVQDLEQKTFIFIVPVVSIVIYVTHPLMNLWIGPGPGAEVISNSTVAVLSSFLLGSITVIPVYQFLNSKGYAALTMILQGSLVVVNTILFFILLDFFGFYAIVIGNACAIIFAFYLSLYFQKRYLNCTIFSNWMQVWKVMAVAVVNISLGYFLNTYISGDWEKIIVIPVLLSISSLILIRCLNLIKEEDVLRYVGKSEKMKTIGIKLFVRKCQDSGEIKKVEN